MRLELRCAARTRGSSSAFAKIDIEADVARLDDASTNGLWVIEDDIRDKERAQAFDAEFIRLARAVYVENDERAAIKRRINAKLGLDHRRRKILPRIQDLARRLSAALERRGRACTRRRSTGT